VDGEDPAGKRRAAREAARTGDTLKQLSEAYWPAAARGLHGGRGRPKRPSTLAAERNRWKLHIGPALGTRKFAELKRSDVRSFMRSLASSGTLAADTVNSVGRTLSAILAFAIHEEQLETNPAAGQTTPLALKSRDRMFDDDSLAAVWGALRSPEVGSLGSTEPARISRLEPSTALALRFAMLTLCRRGEVAGARISEIDFLARKWTIPGERAKSNKAHVVPLSYLAIEIVIAALALPRADGADVLFPAPRDPARSISPDALTRALTRICETESLPHGTPHDFRRSGATTLTGEAYGVRRFTVSKILGHTALDGAAAVTAIYDRNDYLVEKRAALNAWADHVSSLKGSAQRCVNVVAFSKVP
jgi:integrase